MPIRGNLYPTAPFLDFMNEATQNFDPGVVDTFNRGVPEGALNSPSSGPLYISGQIPPPALKQTPDDPVVPHLMPPTLDQRTLAPSPFKPKSLADAITIRDQNGYVVRPYTPEEYKAINPQDKVYADAAQLKNDFPEVPFAPGMTKERAGYIDDMMTTKKVRDILSEKHPWAYMAGQFVGGAPDLTNFVPVFGEFGAGIKFGSNLARLGFSFGKAAAENVVNVAVSDALTYQVRKSYGLDVNIQDDITSAALYGVVFHGAGEGIKFGYGKLKDRLNYKIPEPVLQTKTPLPAAAAPTETATGASPVVATELPPAVVAPTVAPTVAPVEPSGGYTLNGEKVGTTPPIDPFTEYTLNGERVVATSRMIINDAVYNIANGQDISLSESSKGLIEEFHKNGLNNLEEGRYSVARTPEIIAKETELKTALANTASEIDTLKAADSTGIIARVEKFRRDQSMGIDGQYPAAVSMAEKEAISKYEGLKSDISKTNSEIGNLQSRIKGSLDPIGEVSWATPKIEYGSSTIKDQLPTIEKIVSPLATEDIKIKEDAKNIGHNLDDANYKLSDTELLDIEILKSSMTPEEIASFDAELKSADSLMEDMALVSEASKKYAECRSKQ